MMNNARNSLTKLLEGLLRDYRPDLTQAVNQLPGAQVAPAGGGSPGAVALSDDPPADVGDSGAADAGTDTAVSRGDHVHALPATGVTPGTYGDASNIPVIIIDAEGRITSASETPASGGTVTSVGLALPSSVFDVTGSPVTGTGTLTGAFKNQTANTVFKGPNTGSPAVPTFAALVAADIPSLDASKIGSGILGSARGGTGVDNGGRTLTINSNNITLTSSGGAHELTVAADGIAIVQAGGGIVNTRVAFSNADNYLTTDADFTFIAASNELRVPLLRLAEQSTPSTPASGFGLMYFSTAGVPSSVDDAGVIREMVRKARTTFTPTYFGSTTPGTTTYVNQTGFYSRIGDTIFFTLYVSWSNATGTGNALIGGLPFTTENVAVKIYTHPVWYFSVTYTAGTGLQTILRPNTTQIEIWYTPASNTGSAQIAVETAGELLITGHYDI